MFAKESKSGKGGIIFTLILSIVIFLTVYFSCSGKANFSSEAPDLETIEGLLSTSLPLPNDGSHPDEHSPNDNAFYAFTSMAQEESFESYTEGEAITNVALASVSQKIKAHRVVVGDEVYKESLSHSSFKGVGMRTFSKGNNYVVWEANNVHSVDNVEWKSEANKLSKDSYISLFGSVPNAYTAYILTEETILSSEYLGESNGIYSFRYDLNTETATPKIAMEMRTMAGTKSLPLFEKVSLTVRMDENWRIREIVTDCVYQVDMLGGVTCNESMTETFSEYNSNASIPNVDFLRSYLDAEETESIPEELSPTDYLLNGFGEYLTGDKPLRVNLKAEGSEELPLSLDANAEIHINMEDLSAISVRANINSLSYDDLALSDLFIGYEGGKAYIKAGDLKAYGSIEEITAIINRLIPLFSSSDAMTADESAGGLGGLDLAGLLSNATISYGEDVTTVNLPIELGGISLNASLDFFEGETISLIGAKVDVLGISLAVLPDDTLKVDEIGEDYHNIAPIFDIIDENGDLPLNIAIGEDINALVNLHLADMSIDVNLGELQAKYAQNTLFVKYNDLQVKLAIDDIDDIVNKLAPILGGFVELPDLNALAQSLDVMALLSQAIDTLDATEANDVLTVSTSVEGIDLALRFLITEKGYSIGSIDVTLGDFPISVSPTTEEIPAIADETLDSYYNIATLLDIIDENNEINLKASVDTLDIDININLETLTIYAKAEIFGETLLIKFADNIVYVSYKGLNISANVNEINDVMTKLEPIIGKVDLSIFEDINVEEIIDSIVLTDNGNGLDISATLLGLKANIAMDGTNGNLTLASITVAIDELAVSVVPSEKADYTMPDATYYNILSVLDLIDENNEINLQASIEDIVVDVNINLETLTILAKTDIFGETLTIKFVDNIVYISYKGLNVSANVNDIDSVMEKLKPIIGEIDLSAFENIDVQEIIDNILITDNGNGLNIAANLFGFDANIALDGANGNLSIAGISVIVEGVSVNVVPCDKADYNMPEATYYNIVSLLDIIDENSEINLKATVDTLDIDVNINLETLTILAKTEIFGETLLIKFADNIVYVSYKGLNISANVNEINDVMTKLEPIIGKVDLSVFEDINVEEIIDGIAVNENENGLNISASLFGFDANIFFDTTNNDLNLANISVAIEELSVSVVPCEKADYTMPDATYYNILSVLDLIDENNEINLQASIEDIVVDVNINLETLTILAKADIFGETLTIKFVDNIVYISYKGLNVSANVNDIDSVMEKLKPIIGEIDLSAFENIDVQEIIDNILITDNGNGLNIAANLFGFDANIALDGANGNLSIASISVIVEGVSVNVVPCEKADYNMPDATYYNILSLLDIIDENSEINLKATVDTLDIDVNINLETLTILAKTEIFGETLLIKFADNIVYVSYKGLNISANVNEIDSVMAKLEPIIGEIDLSIFEDINVEEIIDGIAVNENENGLNISASLFGFDANIFFDTTNNDLHLANISVAIDELAVSVVSCEKADYTMPNGTYYNAFTLLDLINENNEINLQATIEDIVVDVNINLETLTILAKADIFGETLTIKFVDNIVYISYKGLNVSANVNDIGSVMEKLKPIIGEIDLSAFENIDVQEIIDNILITDNGNGLNIAANLFGFDANIALDGANGNLSIANISVIVEGVSVNVVPCEKADYNMSEATYYNIVSLLDIIDENSEINLKATVDTLDIDVNINLETLTILAKTEIFGETLLIKFADNIVYVSYKGLNISANVNEIGNVMAKLEPIIGEIDLSIFEDINVEEIIDGIAVNENENGLNISASLFGFDANILFDTTNNDLHLANISVAIEELSVSVVPCEKADYTMPNGTYYNAFTLLDLIDNNNEINLQASIEDIVVDVNINLETLTILAKADIFGETLTIKFVDNIVYISYKGLNVSANVNDIDSVMEKLKPIIGEIDLSAFENIDVQEIIDNILITDNGNGLNIAANLFGFDANIALDGANGNLSIAGISVIVEGVSVNVVPCEKADYNMPEATYYNIVTLLDIIDENGYISLSVDLDGTQLLATIDLNTLSLYATIADVEIYANLNTGDLYARYPGVQATVNFNDIEAIMETLQPLLDKFIGEDALGDLNFSNLETIDMEEILSSIIITETNNTLSISLEIIGIDVTLTCSTENGNLTFENASVLLGDMQVEATLSATPYLPYFNTDDTYVDLKELVDTYGQAITDVFTSDELSATLGGTIVSGNSTITLNANVEIKGLETAPQAKALLTIHISTVKEDGSVSETGHEIFLLYNDPSLVASGSPNVYFYYNDLSNATDKFEGSFTTIKFEETLEILKKIYKNMPELADALSFIFVADENGYPTIPEASINLETLINAITLNDGVLTADLNASTFMSNLPESIVATLSAPNDMLTLALPALNIESLSINGLTISLGKPATAFDSTTFTYTSSGKVNDFSSINELLGALETTSRYRSFSITGKVSMKALSILNFTDKATITAKLEIIDNKTYAVVNLAREEVKALGISIWDDEYGNATLYFDPEEQMIYIKDVSVKNEVVDYKWGFIPIYGDVAHYTYKKYTVDDFMANIKNILFDMLHFSSTIRKELDKPSDHVSTATIENTFLGYSYNGTNMFSIDVDLEPLLGDIQDIHLDIGHDANMNINTLYAKMNVVSVLEVKLNASLTTHGDHTQRLDGVISSERSSGNY